jgi:hypothetical protein
MSGGHGGIIIIKPNLRTLASTNAVQEQLGALKLSRLLDVLAKSDDDWTIQEVRFLARCVLDAVEAYE